MLHFCTLFDSGYLTRGIAMYESLKKYCDDFHLYIFAFDDRCYSVLKKLNLSKVTVISLSEFEDKELLRIKSSRSWTEYCWTCASSSILYVLKKYNVDVCTYLDADIYFFSSPKVLLDELNGNSTIITDHRYTPEYDSSIAAGKYCVQFVPFKNDERGLKILKWWRDKCIDWCYERVEKGKFGDQKYLDDWTTRFDGVHVLKYLGGGVAPWNVQQYKIFRKNDIFFGIEKSSGKRFQLIFYHFFGLKFFRNGIIRLALSCSLSKRDITIIYRPYLKHLETVWRKVKRIDTSITFSYPVSTQKPLTTMGIIRWYIGDVKEEAIHLIKAILFINTIKSIRFHNFYYKNKL